MAPGGQSELRLKELCFLTVTENFSALSAHAAEVLPCDLLEELQPHLTVLQLDQIQPLLNSRGLSTLSSWKSILTQILGPSGAQKVSTEDEAKVQVMKNLFTSVLYNSRNDYISSNLSSLDTPLFLCAAAKHMEVFTLRNQPELRRLITRERRCVLETLESHVHCVKVSHSLDPSYIGNWPALLVLHRLLDHGQVQEVSFHARCSLTLAWILGPRGSKAEDSEDHQRSAKQLRLDPRFFPQPGRGDEPLRSCWGERCPRRSLESLELGQCEDESLRELCRALPSLSSLRTLNLHSLHFLTEISAQDLIVALQKQSRSAGGGLTHLEVCTLPCPSVLEQLLEACPRLLSLTVEVLSVLLLCSERRTPTEHREQQPAEFPLLNLRMSLNQQADDELRDPGPLIRSLLKRCPGLRSLHMSGLRLKSKTSYGRLLTALPESCSSLRSLTLDDVNLSDSLEHLLLLLQRCHFTELTLKDCRLMDKCSERRGESLKKLSSALVKHRSLRCLSLAQNRIASHVPVLAQLFSSDSSLQSVDLSRNFIQAVDLLKFSRHIQALRPNHRPTLNLRWNPGDRDPDRWRSAVRSLAPYLHLLLDGWCSTDMMVDHVSNM